MEANSITDLLLLQNLVKRDPTAYRTEFKAQHADFLSTLELYRLAPAKDHKHFSALVKFLASVRQFPLPRPALAHSTRPSLSSSLRWHRVTPVSSRTTPCSWRTCWSTTRGA